MWDQLDALNKENGFAVNDPGFTVKEYASRYEMSTPGAYERLQRLAAQGKLIKGRRRQLIEGKNVYVTVYRLPESRPR